MKSPYFPSALRQSSDNPVWVSAQGAYVQTQDGQRFLDCTSGFGVCTFGHAHPQIIEAVCKQVKLLPHAIPSIFPHAYEHEALSSVARHSPVKDPSVILTSSGSEAVEVALKIAFLATGKDGIAFLDGAYHGQSLGSLRVNGLHSLRAPLEKLIPKNHFILPFPRDINSYKETLNSLSSILDSKISKGNIGAVIVEPMQNPAGYRSLPAEFCVELSSLCKKNNLLLIADEIFTGFGRCGHWCLSEVLGLNADIYCFGKSLTGGIPAGACVSSRDLMSNIATEGGIPLHSPTFLGNPIICAAVSSSINVLEKKNVPERSLIVGSAIKNRLSAKLHDSPLVTDVRGRGCAIAIHFTKSTSTSIGINNAIKAARYLLSHNILAINSGFPEGNVLALTPSALITDDEIDNIVESFLSVHSKLLQEITE